MFRQARSFDSGYSKTSASVIQDWKGQITTISTNKGGTALLLRVELVGENVRVTFQEEGIKPTSAVYSAAGNLGEGECVIFQGKVVSEEDSYSESGAMRAPEYDFEFHQLKGCS